MIVQSSLNLLGSMYIASYSATSKIQNIVMQVYMALGAALATYAGQNYGAGKVDRIKKGLNVSIGVTCCLSVLSLWFVAFFWLAFFCQDICGRSNGGTSGDCGADVSYQSLVLFPAWAYFLISKYTSGYWKWVGADAWRCV